MKVKVALLCLTLCNPMDCSLYTRLLSPWNYPGKNTGVGCHFLLGIFLTQGSNLRLLHWQVDSLLLSHLGRLQPNVVVQGTRLPGLCLDHPQMLVCAFSLDRSVQLWRWLSWNANIHSFGIFPPSWAGSCFQSFTGCWNTNILPNNFSFAKSTSGGKVSVSSLHLSIYVINIYGRWHELRTVHRKTLQKEIQSLGRTQTCKQKIKPLKCWSFKFNEPSLYREQKRPEAARTPF